jgi:hypothetical protein
MGFDESIINKLDEDLQKQKKEAEALKKRGFVFLLAFGGLTISLLVFSISLLLSFNQLTHEYTFVGCELSCARAYQDVHFSSSGYYPTDEGIRCSCYDMRVPPQRRTPPVSILNFT